LDSNSTAKCYIAKKYMVFRNINSAEHKNTLRILWGLRKHVTLPLQGARCAPQSAINTLVRIAHSTHLLVLRKSLIDLNSHMRNQPATRF
ncbi:hypothetical protein, partial [Herminiimonas sp. CN]|uniref:hypothetical protein n=1 Tax=Herminiimonas sp. CN TaxID=1349818 RepID=UPI001EE679ED